MSDEDRFWSKVEFGRQSAVGRCWEWRSKRNRHGYGLFSLGGREVRAHRTAWRLTFGPIPTGLGILHKCDNPPCVRPDHLFPGSQLDNVADMDRKGRGRGRWSPGDEHFKAVLGAADVQTVRQCVAEGETRKALAARFGVAPSTISRAAAGKTWRTK